MERHNSYRSVAREADQQQIEQQDPAGGTTEYLNTPDRSVSESVVSFPENLASLTPEQISASREVARRLLYADMPSGFEEANRRSGLNDRRINAASDDLVTAGQLAAQMFPDIRTIDHVLSTPLPKKKWNTGHFPVGTRVIAGIRDHMLRVYEVTYLIQASPGSFVIQTNEPQENLPGITHSINIDYVREILARGTGPVIIRKPLWDEPKVGMQRYAMTPREAILQECALSNMKRSHRRVIDSAFNEPDPAEKRMSWIQLEPLLNSMTKGRGQYWTGSPQLLVEVLLERLPLDGVVDLDKLTDSLVARGVFIKKYFHGYSYYVASKKKLRRAFGQLLNKSKVRMSQAWRMHDKLDDAWQNRNPFEPDDKYSNSSTTTKGSEYDQRDWDRLGEQLRREPGWTKTWVSHLSSIHHLPAQDA